MKTASNSLFAKVLLDLVFSCLLREENQNISCELLEIFLIRIAILKLFR